MRDTDEHSVNDFTCVCVCVCVCACVITSNVSLCYPIHVSAQY